MMIALIIVSVLLVCVLAYLLGGLVMKKDDAQERRAENYLALSAVLRDAGLKDVPQILTFLAIKDYSSAYELVRYYAQLAKANPETVLKEFDSIFERVLSAKLAKPESRAYIQSRVAEATPPVVEPVAVDAKKVS